MAETNKDEPAPIDSVTGHTPAWVDPATMLFDCTCNLCGALWPRGSTGGGCFHASPSTDGTQHSDAEWAAWGQSQGIAAGEAIPRWSQVS